MRWKNCS